REARCIALHEFDLTAQLQGQLCYLRLPTGNHLRTEIDTGDSEAFSNEFERVARAPTAQLQQRASSRGVSVNDFAYECRFRSVIFVGIQKIVIFRILTERHHTRHSRKACAEASASSCVNPTPLGR